MVKQQISSFFFFCYTTTRKPGMKKGSPEADQRKIHMSKTHDNDSIMVNNAVSQRCFSRSYENIQ
jgi:hypothetical protein